jgi:transposase InsO family protein
LRRKYAKLSIGADVLQQIICNIRIRRAPTRHDNIDFKPIITRTSNILLLSVVTADKGYDSEDNHRLVRDGLHAFSIIPARYEHVPIWRTYGRYRKQMKRGYSRLLYNQRNKDETIVSVIKRLFGEHLMSRLTRTQNNDMLQMDILGPFYLSNSSQRNYIISCLDDCSRNVASRWSERKRSVDVLNVLEDWIMMINGKPKKIMHDNGKQFTSRIFKHFLVHNHIYDKRIPNSYPQMQGKIEAHNKIVKSEFLALEDIPSIDDGKLRYDMFVKAYNEARAWRNQWWSYSFRDVPPMSIRPAS